MKLVFGSMGFVATSITSLITPFGIGLYGHFYPIPASLIVELPPQISDSYTFRRTEQSDTSMTMPTALNLPISTLDACCLSSVDRCI
ncbi:MAG: hypothetical protein IPK92_15880 [Nitrospira sp.]|nr:hypothetical protein [Nitrospira sp.]